MIWVAAARLRTLPLSVAGIVVGNALAYPKRGVLPLRLWWHATYSDRLSNTI
jgi:1,4-dihydroxy-2-naphthoate octaprenyltransferase